MVTYKNRGACRAACPKAATVLTEGYLILPWLCDLERVIRCFWTSDPSFIKQKTPNQKTRVGLEHPGTTTGPRGPDPPGMSTAVTGIRMVAPGVLGF